LLRATIAHYAKTLFGFEEHLHSGNVIVSPGGRLLVMALLTVTRAGRAFLSLARLPRAILSLLLARL